MPAHVRQVHGGPSSSEALAKNHADFISSYRVSDQESIAVKSLSNDMGRKWRGGRKKQLVAVGRAGTQAGIAAPDAPVPAPVNPTRQFFGPSGPLREELYQYDDDELHVSGVRGIM